MDNSHKKHPAIDLGACTDCGGCVAVCPEVFRNNPECGFMEVIELPAYPVAEVDEAIKFCPEDCIAWED